MLESRGVADTPERKGTAPPVNPALAVDVDGEEPDTGVQLSPPPSSRKSQISMRRITRPSFLLELVAGSPVGEYEIEAQIGEGAMGTVYSAVHPLIGKKVAVKVLKPELCANQTTLDRFLHEAQAVNKIGHPNIVDVFSFNELPDGRVYFVMEWLRGEDLKTRLARGPMSVNDACDILDGIARALEAAHAKQIVHRDLKPDNVFLHRVDDGPMMVKLLDFGIAKLVRVAPGSEKTQTGNMLGTPRYISPEQARGVIVDFRSDVYSLGAMAFEMLAGRTPFQGETAMDLVGQHMNEPAPALSTFAKVPRALEQTVMRMLEKDPASRPGLEDVRQVLQDPQRKLTPLPARPGTQAGMRAAPSGSKWKTVAIGAAALAAIGVGVGTWKLVSDNGDTSTATPAVMPEVAPPPAPVAPAQPAAVPAPPAAQPRAWLDVRVTNAKDATIFVDGQEWGRGVAVKVAVDPGPHDVVVIPLGTRAKITQHVEVGPDQTSSVELSVPSSPVVTRPPARPPVKQPKPPQQPAHGRDDDELLAPKARPK